MNAWLDGFVPAFGLLALGAFLKRYLLPDDRVWAGIEKLCFWVLLPSLIVSAIATVDLRALPLGGMLLAIWGGLAIGAAVSLLLSRGARQPHASMTSVLMGGIRFNNLIGFALCGALYGPPGIQLGAVATGFIVPFVQMATTVAFALKPGQGVGIRPLRVLWQVLSNPLVVACGVGFLCALLGGLPPGMQPLLRSLGNATVALGLLCVGAALTIDALRDRPGVQAATTVIKLVVVPAATLLLGRALGLPPMPLAVALVFMALPTAATSYVMARSMGGDAPLMAAITTAEHLAAILTLPLWVLLLARL